jgi:hypothetical protein
MIPERRTVRETFESHPEYEGVIKRLDPVKVAIGSLAIEAPGVVATFATGKPWLIGTAMLNAWVIGETVHNFHNQRYQPKASLHPISKFFARSDRNH